MHSVSSNAVAEALAVSDAVTIVDDSTATIIVRTCGKIIIVDIFAKTAASSSYSISPYTILPMGQGLKTPLTWERQLRGEAYYNISTGMIQIDTQNGGVGSGQIVAFLA